jgi:hypothetical protein
MLLTLGTTARVYVGMLRVDRIHDVMSPGVTVPGRWPSILGEKERGRRETSESKCAV